MARDINSATVTAGAAEVVRIVWLLELEYAPQTSRIASPDFDVYWSSDGGSPDDRFIGVGLLLEITGIEESAEQQSRGVTLKLSGVPTSSISLALTPSDYVGRPATVWLALLDENNGIIGAPTREITGLMDTQDIVIGDKTGTIELTLTDRRSRWDQPLRRRYTNEEQQARFAGDRGLEFIADLADKEIAWPERLAPR